ncbi:diaminopimelate decarboxylase [Streptosporangium becharense]|uniref:Diaminopimelate decarboxylase n=1 Tax=Streptosporangium becharense TaxID=1816182 RepID=A0A7W9MEM0_9ACTN|nr:type III PLP-dependent enzyme [Streptosporangium becharense]MBB2913063.1 diaminopimelate decarboxylase [Streptosporangium becharense]MBB5818112.1 diaminopimelate decarboxylase [Streptosporangium becharense]
MSRHADLVARYGSPLYVYDLDRVTAARDALLSSLPEGVELFFSFKANPHPEIARALRGDGRNGCMAEISSTGELAAALEAGFDGSQVLYTGPGKTYAEIEAAVDAGVAMFSVESPTDLQHVGEVATGRGVVVDCLLRVNSATSSAATSIRMTGTPSQFGIDSETLPELMPELRTVPGTRLAGVHLFSLSNSKDEESLVAEFRNTISVAARLEREAGLPIRFLDIGGGFAAPYLTPGERPVYPNLRAELSAILDEHFPAWREGTPRVACESGRHLVGDCGELLSTVVNIKESRGRKFVILDAGINTLGGMSGLGRLLPVSVRPAEDDLPEGAGPAEQEVATLAGPLCTPGDILGKNVRLPVLKIGDVVGIPNAGAYGMTASLLMFLGRPAPAEVVVRGGEVVSASRIEFVRTYQ